MNRTEALKKLRTFADALKARGATSLYLFGSTAKNRANAKSDLDLFIDYNPRGRFNAFDLVASQRLLQEGLGVDVDLTTRKGLHPLIRSRLKLRLRGFFHELCFTLTINIAVMPGLVPGIHGLRRSQKKRRGWPGRARP
jgi:uncharacterized protein